MTAEFPAFAIIIAILITVLGAGIVKGSLGIGFPAVAMSILPIIIEPALAVAIMSLPIVITNGQQFLSIKGWFPIIKRFLWAGGSLFISIFIVSQFLADVPSRWINVLVGMSLVVFAVSALFRVKLHLTEDRRWQILVGITAGFFGGVSAVKAPVMIYTVALDLPRDEFIAAAGFLFFCGGVGMVGGLVTANLANSVTLTLSLSAVFAGLAGFHVGARIRQHLSAAMFRGILLWAMLALGLRQVIVNLI